MIDGKDGMTRLRTHTLVLPVIAVLVGVVAALALLAVGSAQAPLSGMVFYQADLTGDQVVPPVATPDCDDPGPDGTVRPIMGLERANAGACGVFEAEGEEGGGEIRFRLEAQVPGITQAHIHLGGPAENGPVAAFLFGPADPAVDEIAVSGALTVDDLVGPVAGDWEAFIAGLFAGAYVQIHTEMNPAGALRGQIFVALPAPLAPEPTVGGELPPDPDRPPPVDAPGPPSGLPTTGNGGLADADRRAFGLAPLLPTLAGLLTAGIVLAAIARRPRQRH